MITHDTLDHWFTHHAPTDETALKYAAIQQADAATTDALVELFNPFDGNDPKAAYATVTEMTRSFAGVILDVCPPCADTTTAIRCVRLARMVMNEALTEMARLSGPAKLSDEQSRTIATTVGAMAGQAGMQLREARWWASSAIACGGR